MILVKPYLGCNLRCAYCYQADIREHDNPHTKMNYDLDAVLKTMEALYKEEKQNISLHGGEPLAIPIEDIEAILRKSFELQGRSAIQTNGYLINDEIITLFKKYKTGVGISIDGFYPENKLRGFPGNAEKTKEYTKRVLDNIETLCAENVIPGIIVVLHKANTTGKHLERLKDFIRWLSKLGVKSGKLNPCSVDNPKKAKKIELSSEELKHVWLEMAKFTLFEDGLKWDPFTSMLKNLRGNYLGDCIFTQCDFWNTHSAQVILGDGSVSCCARTFNLVGSTFIRAYRSFERYEVLEKTDCAGCRYWSICNGGCPSRGINGDWRNKDKYCEAIYALYEYLEKHIKAFDPNAVLVTDKNYKKKAYYHSEGEHGDHHGDHRDHGDSYNGQQRRVLGYRGHGDSPHGDHRDHGDSPHGDHSEHMDR